jgi:hypothetical protein
MSQLESIVAPLRSGYSGGSVFSGVRLGEAWRCVPYGNGSSVLGSVSIMSDLRPFARPPEGLRFLDVDRSGCQSGGRWRLNGPAPYVVSKHQYASMIAVNLLSEISPISLG